MKNTQLAEQGKPLITLGDIYHSANRTTVTLASDDVLCLGLRHLVCFEIRSIIHLGEQLVVPTSLQF
jgi:hypothetical protein